MLTWYFVYGSLSGENFIDGKVCDYQTVWIQQDSTVSLNSDLVGLHAQAYRSVALHLIANLILPDKKPMNGSNIRFKVPLWEHQRAIMLSLVTESQLCAIEVACLHLVVYTTSKLVCSHIAAVPGYCLPSQRNVCLHLSTYWRLVGWEWGYAIPKWVCFDQSYDLL